MDEEIAARQFGKYRLLEKIGSGGMAEIWKASLVGIDGFEKILVVKKILPQYARHRQFINMFVQEAKVCAGLQHANVVQIYELEEVHGEHYIAMEYVNGCDLLQVLTRATQQDKPVPVELCLFIVSEVCKGLGYAHTASNAHGKPLEIVHLDVSPSNILLGLDGEVKLTDFGVAKATIEGKPAGADDRLKGKLGYMSPEQVTGKVIDHRSDIFSIGILLYELCTLKRLFLGKTDLETLSNIRDADIESRLAKHPEIPVAVADILRKALRRNQDTRFQTAHEVEEAISQHLFESRMRVTPQRLGVYIRELLAEPGPVLVGGQPGGGGHSGRVHETRSSARREAKRPFEPRRARPRRGVTPVKMVPHRSGGGRDSTFHFRSADGGMFGPITCNNLKNLLRTHSLSPDELVSVDGEEWRPLRDVSVLTDLIPNELRSESRSPDDTGAFGPSDAARRIVRMVAGKWTGRLKLLKAERLKEVFFRRGRPIHISSNLKRELFGSMLVEHGLARAEDLKAAFDYVKQKGGPLGTALVQLGLLDQGSLFRELDAQFREKFIEVFSWHDATFEYYSGHEPAHDVVPFSLDPYPAITEALRRFIDSSTLEAHFAPLLNRTARLAADPFFPVSKLRLAPREHRVWVALESRPISVRSLLETVGPKLRETALLTLFVLQQTEQIRIG